MTTFLVILICVVLGPPALLLVLYTLGRLLKRLCVIPCPVALADLIDNRFRRRIQPPEETAERHGIKPGMIVLEVGPGNGTYALAVARTLGPEGKLVAVDVQQRMIDKVAARAAAEGIDNVEVLLADVHALPFDDRTFDAVFLIFVIGEIREPARAMTELCRVLKPGGTAAFTEHFMDPYYHLRRTLVRWAASAGLQLKKRLGNFFLYTLIFEKR